jgi:Auxiliary Activity family 9 (formerly GH61)
MTSCNGDCTTFAANDAHWFKIDAAGYDSGNKQWAAAKLIAGALTSYISVLYR